MDTQAFDGELNHGLQPGASAEATRLYALPSGGFPRFKVVLVAPAHVPMWVVRFLTLAARDDWIELVVVPFGDEMAGGIVSHLPIDIRAYLALDRVRRRQHLTLGSAALVTCIGIDFEPAIRAGGDAQEVRSRVEGLSPDLVVLLGAPSAHAALADCARWGCWRVGESLTSSDVAARNLLAPILRGDPSTALALELDWGQGPRSLVTSYGATWPGSFNLQLDQAFLKLPALLLRALRRLATGDIAMPQRQASLLTLPAPGTAVNFGSGLRALSIALRQTVRWQLQKRRAEELWVLLLRDGSRPLDPGAPEIGPSRVLEARPENYWADPCVVEAFDRRLVFAEEYSTHTRKAVITCLELLPDGSVNRLGIALDEPFHLSYPQAFQWEDQWYLTVESSTPRRVGLYCTSSSDFPLGWHRLTGLVVGQVCVDPTLHHHEGHWYLFVNVSESGGSTCDELFLFVADVLTGPYRPHPMNPIVADVRRARSAGRLFRRGAKLIRPGQDCALSYGAAIAFNEVLDLTPSTYLERPLARLDASEVAPLNACHTYSAGNHVEVLDARGRPPGRLASAVIGDARIGLHRRVGSVPLVSAIIHVYNGERRLGQAIDSALEQSFGDIEVIVVDDGSSDGSGALADRYQASHPDRVRVVQQEHQGFSSARNAAVDTARGRYVAFLEAGDVWVPGHIEHCVTLLERDSSLGLVHANRGSDGGPHGQRNAAVRSGRWGRQVTDPHAALLLWQESVAGSTAVCRRSVMDTIGHFDTLFSRPECADRDMWLRIAEVARVAYIDEVHAFGRTPGYQEAPDRAPGWHARRLLVDKHIDRPRGRSLRRHALAAIDAKRGHELAILAPLMPAVRAFCRSIARDPSRVDAWEGLFRRLTKRLGPPAATPR